MEHIKKILAGLLALLYLGGLICIVVACVQFFKAFVPILASLVVIAASVPTAVEVFKRLLKTECKTTKPEEK